MRYILMILTLGFLQACSSDECEFSYESPDIANQSVYENDILRIQQYIEDNELDASSTASGLHYVIHTEGGESKPELCDNVSVSYSLYNLDDEIIEESPGINFQLSLLIPSWQEGIALIGKGGSITILSPSYLAYGPQSPSPSIPANSVLIFDIELQDF